MIERLTILPVISLAIAGVHVAFADGNILAPVRIWAANQLDRLGLSASKYIQKPLWSCLPCMGGIWTILLTWRFDLLLILAVVGLNALLERLYYAQEDLAGISSDGDSRIG